MLTILDKQKAVKDLINKVAPKVEVMFDNSRRAKRLFGRYYAGILLHRVVFYRPLFNHTLNSCLHCAFHELAHFCQYTKYHYTRHDRVFYEIKLSLINNYGNDEILKANKSDSIKYSDYDIDNNVQSQERTEYPKRLKHTNITL